MFKGGGGEQAGSQEEARSKGRGKGSRRRGEPSGMPISLGGEKLEFSENKFISSDYYLENQTLFDFTKRVENHPTLIFYDFILSCSIPSIVIVLFD